MKSSHIKYVCLFALLIFSLSLHFSFAYADSFGWSLSDDGVLSITGSGIIPPSYHPWIDDYHNQQKITSIVFDDAITEIGDFVLNGLPQVRTVSLPSSLEVLGGQNFRGCENLESIVFPEQLREIDYCCFLDCDKLTSVTIPASVTTIGFGAFTHCDSLLNIYVASENSTFQSIDGVLFEDDSLLCYPIGRSDKTYTVPAGTTRINQYAFSDSAALEEVILPVGLTWIGESFSGCSALCRLTLPESLTGIGYYAFSGCVLLESVKIPDSVESMGEYVFPKTTIIICSKQSAAERYAQKNGHRILYTDEFTSNALPAGLNIIESEAFLNTGFSFIYIPDSVTDIGEESFSHQTIIVCSCGSYANDWAKSRGYSVVNID